MSKKNHGINEIKEFVLMARTKKEVLEFLKRQRNEREILAALISVGDIDILKKLPSQRFDGMLSDMIALIFGDEGLDYLPSTRHWEKENYRGKLLESRAERIGFSDKRKTYYIDYAIFINGEFSHTYKTEYFQTLRALSEANGGNLAGLKLFDKEISPEEAKGIDFSGAYVKREDLGKFQGALPVDYQIISKCYNPERTVDGKIQKPYFSVRFGYVSEDRNICSYDGEKEFRSFDSFAKFLNNDLSSADLTGYDLSGVDLKKYILKGAKYDNPSLRTSTEIIEELTKTAGMLSVPNTNLPVLQHEEACSECYALYISDIHLDHKIISKCNSNYEAKEYLNQKIKELYNSKYECNRRGTFHYSPLIILGDISCSFDINAAFLRGVSDCFSNIIFVIGNHELWEGNYIEQINKYRNLCKRFKITLLDNGMLVVKDAKHFGYNESYYSEAKLNEMSVEQIRKAVIKSRFVIFGGTGYAGLNDAFNAKQGIYRDAMTRRQEIGESKKISALYNKINEAMGNKQVVVATHMPKNDWSSGNNNPNWIYLNGHTHHNYFVNNIDNHIFADNQIGYGDKHFGLKHFNYNGRYDLFDSYDDGIYEITSKQYKEFCIGKNISMQYTCDLPVIMLKKNDYYMFMRKHRKHYVVLNGGSPIKTPYSPEYFFDNMEQEVEMILSPLKKYTVVQKEVSRFVQSFGGSGYIHGAIVDIDFYNHLFVYPDGKVVPYYATDIVNKTTYSDLGQMLKENNKPLYLEYKKTSASLPIVANNASVKKSSYTDTDIYKVSNIIRSMQYIQDVGVIRKWYQLSKNNEEQILLDAGRYLEEQ